MAIEFFTGFEGCASNGQVAALFDYMTGNLDLRINNGGFPDNSNSIWATEVGQNCIPAKTKVAGLHRRHDGYSASDLIRFKTDGNVTLVSIGSYTGNYITVKLNGSIIFTSDSNLPLNLIHHIEAKVFVDASVGTIQVKINGSLIADLSNLNTGTEDITRVTWGHNHSSTHLDNLFIADDWQGELYSYVLKPNLDETVQFTPSSGTDNYALLETNDGDTSYVQSDTIGHKDLYSFEDIPEGLIPLSVSVQCMARKEGTGERKLQMISKQDATEYNETGEVILGTGYPNSAGTGIESHLSTAPDGTAWTREKINAMQFGFKVTG